MLKPGQRYLVQTAPHQSVHEATGLQIGCGPGTGCGKSAASAVNDITQTRSSAQTVLTASEEVENATLKLRAEVEGFPSTVAVVTLGAPTV